MANTYNKLADYIIKLLHRIDIFHPHQLTMENIYPRLGLTVYHIPHDSMAIDGILFLDNRKGDAYVREWLEQYVKDKLRPNTYKTYRTALEKRTYQPNQPGGSTMSAIKL